MERCSDPCRGGDDDDAADEDGPPPPPNACASTPISLAADGVCLGAVRRAASSRRAVLPRWIACTRIAAATRLRASSSATEELEAAPPSGGDGGGDGGDGGGGEGGGDGASVDGGAPSAPKETLRSRAAVSLPPLPPPPRRLNRHDGTAPPPPIRDETPHSGPASCARDASCCATEEKRAESAGVLMEGVAVADGGTDEAGVEPAGERWWWWGAKELRRARNEPPPADEARERRPLRLRPLPVVEAAVALTDFSATARMVSCAAAVPADGREGGGGVTGRQGFGRGQSTTAGLSARRGAES